MKKLTVGGKKTNLSGFEVIPGGYSAFPRRSEVGR